ncbi:protein LHCP TRANSLOCATION DEFECT-like [Selaginella moellendorffii]|uniref:protein LHCP TRANSLOCATION DEFECT-like n=1 Tax=Selaginella moellendorffii TaxID=88036 RepID=UPI000D1C70B2|nr:protein LHCP TRANSLOCATION DEFECT-like [Selaginella moellendorffii]|eukprot:XP_024532935.1 protein LHCP TRANSLOCATION DEFECT-like [Selaginella moellendorffii]
MAACIQALAIRATLPSAFLGTSQVSWRRQQRLVLANPSGSRVSAWFKFGNRGLDSQGAGIYGSQKRDDFNKDDVEQVRDFPGMFVLMVLSRFSFGFDPQYFNYMGMLATEGSYDKMDALLNEGLHPVDILLLMASSEGDKPKIEELLRAGASYTVKDGEGRTALDRAKDDEIRDLIQNFQTVPSP